MHEKKQNELLRNIKRTREETATKTLLAGTQLYTRFRRMYRYFVQINRTLSGYGKNAVVWWHIYEESNGYKK